MAGNEIVGLICFVVRCTCAATLSYLLASAAGLPHPLWACISALVVSQDSVAATLETISGRVIGTVVGITIGVAVSTTVGRFAPGQAVQIAIAIAICAIFAWRRPAIRSCLWTSPIVLMTATSTESIFTVAFYRGCEVTLGVLVAGLLHVSAEKVVAWAHQSQRHRESSS